MQSTPITRADLLDPNRLRALLNPDPPKVISIPDDQIITTKKHNLLEALDHSSLPKSYSSTSNKEAILLEFAEDFRRQFVTVHPNRPQLLLYPKNECAVRKFISTYIRPTLLSFQDLHDMNACARFVSDFLEYLPLDDPVALPDTIQSLTTMLRTRAGDCVDMSIFLCSLLRGAGYTAFVVTGFAPEWVTTLDLSDQPCPFQDLIPAPDGLVDDSWGIDKYSSVTRAALASRGFDEARLTELGYITAPPPPPTPAESAAAAAAASRPPAKSNTDSSEDDTDTDAAAAASSSRPSRYTPHPQATLHSSFIEQMELERLALRDMRAQAAAAAAAAEDEKRQERDLLASDRVHAWVMVLPAEQPQHRAPQPRVPSQPVFIEPSSGGVYAVDSAPYLGITAAFNERQYWACLQPHRSPAALGAVMDLSDSTVWEPLLPLATDLETATAAPSASALSGGSPGSSGLSLVTMPPSWVARPLLSREQHESRFPTGRRISFYRNSVCERFRQHETGLQGLILQLTEYAPTDDLLEQPIRVTSVYAHRRDGLLRRVSFPSQERAHELYCAGRQGGLREVAQVTAKQRLLWFDPDARVDRLAVRVETVAAKVVEVFEGRRDRLVSRAVTADTGASSSSSSAAAAGAGAGAGPSSNASGRGAVAPAGRVVTIALGRGTEQPVHRITETFDRDPSVPAHADVCRRSFLLAEGLVRTEYHRAPRQLRHAVWVLDKDDRGGGSRAWAGAGADVGSASSSSPTGRGYEEGLGPEVRPVPSAGERRDAAQALLLRERAVVAEVRERERLLVELLQRAEHEKHDSGLDSLPYRAARAVVAAQSLAEPLGPESNTPPAAPDVLLRFLPAAASGQVPAALSRGEAAAARARCVGWLQQRLVGRAAVMQARLEGELSKLAQAQGQVKRGGGGDREEETQQRYLQAGFRIEVLKTRIKLHEEAAIEKYVQLEQKLAKHPLLKVLYE